MQAATYPCHTVKFIKYIRVRGRSAAAHVQMPCHAEGQSQRHAAGRGQWLLFTCMAESISTLVHIYCYQTMPQLRP